MLCGITSVAFSVSGRLLFAGYDDFECKVRLILTNRLLHCNDANYPGLGRSARRQGRFSQWPREPRQLSWCQQRRHQFVYWILGFYGKSPIISVLYHRHTNSLNSSRSGRDKTVRNQDTPIFRNVIFQRLSFLIFFFLISDLRV